MRRRRWATSWGEGQGAVRRGGPRCRRGRRRKLRLLLLRVRFGGLEGGSCCRLVCSAEELPEEAVVASLGCGNPRALATLFPGEGIDVLLSARRVSPGGQGVRRGHDGRDAGSETLDRYLDESFDCVVTVCDDARKTGQVFPGAKNRLYRPFMDPSRAAGGEEECLGVFGAMRDEILDRIERELVLESRDSLSR